MNALLLTGGRVIDPANRLDALGDVLIIEGRIAAVGPEAAIENCARYQTYDLARRRACPSGTGQGVP